jgi:hypothetical protein
MSGATGHGAAERRNSRCCCALAAKRLSTVWRCAGLHLVMSTVNTYLLTVSGERPTVQMVSVLRCLNAVDDGTNDHCGAPTSNDCQSYGSAQARVRQSQWSVCTITTDGGRKWKGNRVDLLVTARPNRSRGAGEDRRIRVDSHRSSVGDAPRGMRRRPCVTRSSAR